jgi:hypothetical protein
MIVRRYKPYGFLQSLLKLENLWKDIFMDFIIGLPLSLREDRVFNVILAVVDRYSKIAYFILITINVDVPALVKLIYKIVKYHDISKLIISDRESIFIFKW